MAIKIRTQVTYNPFPSQITVLAMEGSEMVGSYSLTIGRNNQVYSVRPIECNLSGRGIPRRLVTAAANALQQVADKRNKSLSHRERFLTRDSQTKLPHIFRQLGYILTDQKDEGIPLRRVYRPATTP